jgi:phospholipid/cholesterol/gamma-HCH transport system permease protein
MGIFLVDSLTSLATSRLKVRRVFRQIDFIGWQSVSLICLTGAFTGMVLSLQGFNTLKRVGSESLLGPLVALSLVRELGPVLAALLVTGRAGSAITAEIAIMRNNEQIDAIQLMGLDPLRYLVVPNIVAGVLAMAMLTWIFDVVGIFGGYLIGVRMLGLPVGTYFGEITRYLEFSDILGGTWKSLSFGLIMAWTCCYKGYTTGLGAEGAGRATTQAVVRTSVLILVWDFFMTSLVF